MTIVAFNVLEFFRVEIVNRPLMLNYEVANLNLIALFVESRLRLFVAYKWLFRIFHALSIHSVVDNISLDALGLLMSEITAFVTADLFTIALSHSQSFFTSIKLRAIFGPVPGISAPEACLHVSIMLVLYLNQSFHLLHAVSLIVAILLADFTPESPLFIAYREYRIWHVTILLFVPRDLAFWTQVIIFCLFFSLFFFPRHYLYFQYFIIRTYFLHYKNISILFFG